MYEPVIIRPPSEAASFLLPVTAGCSHDRCTFCGAYQGIKFRILRPEEIYRHIDDVARGYSWSVRRVFLENGDALIAPQHLLVEVLQHLRKRFPHLERVGTYATPRSALIKSVDELKELKRLGLEMAYLGVETGDPELLRKVDKGVSYQEMVEAGRRLKQAGITVSATVILGLGGVAGSQSHALGTAKILTDIDPDYAGALTLMLNEGTPLHKDWQEGRFQVISPFQALEELKVIIRDARFTRCFFTANHASNYLPIKAWMPEEKEKLLARLEDVLKRKDESQLRPDFMRAL